MRRWWHFGWAAVVVGALLINAFWPQDPAFSVWAMGLVAYPVAAALVLTNRPGNRVGVVLAVVAVAAGVIFIGSWAAWIWSAQQWSLYLEAGLGLAVPVLFWGVIALLYVFPTGTIPGRLFRGVFAVFTLVIGVMAVLAFFQPGPLPDSGRDNPLGGPAWVGTLFDAGIAVLVPGVAVGIWSALSRRRQADPVERAQMKWFVAGTAAVVSLVAVVALVPDPLPSPYEWMLYPVVVAGFWALPAAIVVAITRYRLYEIDRIVSRTVPYAVVVALLAGVFAGVVVGLQALIPTGSSSLAVAGSTLLVAAVFTPLRRRVQRVVERRFSRSRYEAAEVVARVAEELRDSADMDVVVARTRAVVAEVFAPSAFAIWIVDQDGHK